MNTFLFIWNPKKWDWKDLDESIEILRNTGHVSEPWSCISHKKIKIGDRAFLLRLGKEPKGIVGSGFVVSNPFLEEHWGGENKLVYKVIIDFDILINAEKEPLLDIDILRQGNLAQQTWISHSSGISIKPKLIDELEILWFSFLKKQKIRSSPFEQSQKDLKKSYTEGSPNQTLVTAYERNPQARKDCLEHYGYSCRVCEFDFGNTYGTLGENFIHVHHRTPISIKGQAYEVDPVKDLIPVCPNCHAMLHKRIPPFSIEELKARMKS